MHKRVSIFLSLTMLLSLVLSACGGGGGDAPVSMQKSEGTSFSIEYPKAWKESRLGALGLTIAVFGPKERSMADLQSMDFENMVTEDPIVLVMVVPEEMSQDMGLDDIDAALDRFDNAIPEKDADILKQEDTSIGDAQGKVVVAKGDHPQMGEIGIHLAVARYDDGTIVVFMGATPGKDRDKNLDIFDYMHKSFKSKK